MAEITAVTVVTLHKRNPLERGGQGAVLTLLIGTSAAQRGRWIGLGFLPGFADVVFVITLLAAVRIYAQFELIERFAGSIKLPMSAAAAAFPERSPLRFLEPVTHPIKRFDHVEESPQPA